MHNWSLPWSLSDCYEHITLRVYGVWRWLIIYPSIHIYVLHLTIYFFQPTSNSIKTVWWNTQVYMIRSHHTHMKNCYLILIIFIICILYFSSYNYYIFLYWSILGWLLVICFSITCSNVDHSDILFIIFSCNFIFVFWI